MEKLISKYLGLVDIPVSRDYCERCMVSHPDYPSLLSAADTLSRLGVAHRVARIEKDHLKTIDLPFVLHAGKPGAPFRLIKSRQELRGWNKETDGDRAVILKVESGQSITDPQHDKQYTSERRRQGLSAAALAAITALLIILGVQSGILLQGLLVVTAWAGAGVGYLLLAKELGITYKPVETFCNAGKRTNCDRILHAKDAQLFGFLTFTDLAAGYFAFQLLAAGVIAPLAARPASYLAPLAGAALLTLPVIGYSLYYQYRRANTWCRLCLLVDGILAGQLAIFAGMVAGGGLALYDAQVIPFVISALLFLATAAAIAWIKMRLQTTNAARREETVAKRVKHDPQVFAHLLLQEEKMAKNLNEPRMMLGSPQAPVRVTMAANLFCNPCRKAFQTVNQLLTTYPQQINFSIRLTPGMNKTMDDLPASTYMVRYWQQHIYGKTNHPELTRQLLQDWYEQMDPQAFIAAYPADGELADAATGEPEAQHYDWVEQNEITATPTFFVNGYRLPKNYRLKDLKALLPGLVAHINEINKEAFAVKSKKA